MIRESPQNFLGSIWIPKFSLIDVSSRIRSVACRVVDMLRLSRRRVSGGECGSGGRKGEREKDKRIAESFNWAKSRPFPGKRARASKCRQVASHHGIGTGAERKSGRRERYKRSGQRTRLRRLFPREMPCMHQSHGPRTPERQAWVQPAKGQGSTGQAREWWAAVRGGDGC